MLNCLITHRNSHKHDHNHVVTKRGGQDEGAAVLCSFFFPPRARIRMSIPAFILHPTATSTELYTVSSKNHRQAVT